MKYPNVVPYAKQTLNKKLKKKMADNYEKDGACTSLSHSKFNSLRELGFATNYTNFH